MYLDSLMQMGYNVYIYNNWCYGKLKDNLINNWIPDIQFTTNILAYYLNEEILEINYRFGVERNTLLHLVLMENREDLAYMLITEFKANVNAKNMDGQTPLYIVLNNNFNDTVRLLLVRALLKNGLNLYLIENGERQGDMGLKDKDMSIQNVIIKYYNNSATSLLKALHLILHNTINKDEYIIHHKIAEILALHTLTYLYIQKKN